MICSPLYRTLARELGMHLEEESFRNIVHSNTTSPDTSDSDVAVMIEFTCRRVKNIILGRTAYLVAQWLDPRAWLRPSRIV